MYLSYPTILGINDMACREDRVVHAHWRCVLAYTPEFAMGKRIEVLPISVYVVCNLGS